MSKAPIKAFYQLRNYCSKKAGCDNCPFRYILKYKGVVFRHCIMGDSIPAEWKDLQIKENDNERRKGKK